MNETMGSNPEAIEAMAVIGSAFLGLVIWIVAVSAVLHHHRQCAAQDNKVEVEQDIHTPVYCSVCGQIDELWSMDWDKRQRYACLGCRAMDIARYGS